MNGFYNKLEELLDAEHEALLQGDLERISAMMAEKEALVNEMENVDGDLQDLSPLREKVSRNHSLFDSALAGIRAVIARLGSLQTVSRQLDTYDASGRRFTIGNNVQGKLEKRA